MGRKKWKRRRANHTFNWNFVINHVVLSALPQGGGNEIISDTNTTYTGTETHNNNQEAVKTIYLVDGFQTPSFVENNRFVLVEVFSNGTSQTTNYLSPISVVYGCS